MPQDKPKEKMNIHQKILKIADAAGVLQKTKEGFNYKYVPEEDVQAKVTACMQKYNVMLYPSIVPDTLSVTPYTYEKVKTKKVKDEDGKYVDVSYTVPINEVIVKAEVIYTWVNADEPDEKVECRWAYIGQMEDASQAFGAGATYGNRYYLMKALQLATTEADPDAYRSKQARAEQYEEEKQRKEVDAKIKEVVAKGSELIKAGFTKEQVGGIVGEHNDGNINPSSLKTIEECDAVLADFKKLQSTKSSKRTSNKGETK